MRRPEPRRVLVVGCGFVGAEVLRRLAALGYPASGITASHESAAALSAEGLHVEAADLAIPATLARWAGCVGTVIHCASSGRGGAEAYRRVFLGGVHNLLETLKPDRLVFTSSTSVYAQTDGSWVDESSPAQPVRDTGKILLETEMRVLNHGGVVLRLAGLYGPGRWVLLRNFLSGTARLEDDGSRWVNQLHRDDAASAAVHAATTPLPSGIFNVSDDSPTRQRTVYEVFSRHFARPMPPGGPINLDRKRGWTHKRVSNAKLKASGWACHYPDFTKALSEFTDPDFLG